MKIEISIIIASVIISASILIKPASNYNRYRIIPCFNEGLGFAECSFVFDSKTGEVKLGVLNSEIK